MKRLLVAAALLWGLSAPAFAQAISYQNLTGQEAWPAGAGIGGSSAYLTTDIVRNSTQAVFGTVAGNITLNPLLNDGGNFVVTAQPAAANLTLPPNPMTHGAIVGVCNPTAAAWATNVVTVVANTGQTVIAGATLTTLGATTCARFQFNLANTSWYRVQ